jgi:hypothetical protein
MRFLVTVVVAAIAAQATACEAVAQDQPTVVSYWHVWTDKDGVTHQNRCELRNFVLKSMEPPASPQWQGRMDAAGSTVIVTVQPVGSEGVWHQNSRPQWIVPLSGRWFVQTMDGKRVEMGSGEISFGEDQNTKPNAQGRKGHLSGTVGRAPAVLMVVQMASEPTVDQPCHLK